MIQRISPPFLMVQGKGKHRAHIRVAVKRGRNYVEEELISKKGIRSHEPQHSFIIKADSSFVQPCH